MVDRTAPADPDPCRDEAEQVPEARTPRAHLLIAGTGRAGTSFLVRYLTELGLDTQLARDGESAWDEDANAGLETLPLPGENLDHPYVLKSPWLYECIDHILSHDTIWLDAVIIPVRRLSEAASSRSITELQAMHRSASWMTDLDQTWETWAKTPGGTIYSLNPIDQGRLLAVGLHVLIERLTKADIPIVLLSFPRLIEDWEYLFRKLRLFLPAAAQPETARAAHQRVADLAKVRVGAELAAATRSTRLLRYEAPEQIDAIALRREMTRVRAALADRDASAARTDEELAQLRASLAVVNDMAARGREAAATVSHLQTVLDSLYASRSWRLTRPYRALGAWFKPLLARPGATGGVTSAEI